MNNGKVLAVREIMVIEKKDDGGLLPSTLDRLLCFHFFLHDSSAAGGDGSSSEWSTKTLSSLRQ